MTSVVCFFQGFGGGLAVIPFMGLLETIAIAKAFGKCVHSEEQDASRAGFICRSMGQSTTVLHSSASLQHLVDILCSNSHVIHSFPRSSTVMFRLSL